MVKKRLALTMVLIHQVLIMATQLKKMTRQGEKSRTICSSAKIDEYYEIDLFGYMKTKPEENVILKMFLKQ